jgi:acetolactate synthase-1/2/3 large subunit
MSVKLSDFVMQFVADQGVKHVFMLPGGGAMHLNDSLGQCKDLAFVCNLHEQAAAVAAEAYARVTNNLGVAMVTTGPGGTNAITGVAGAWLDSTPMLVLSGQVKRSDLVGNSGLRQLGVQEIDIVSIVRSITKYAVTVMEPESIRYHLEKAVYLAKKARSGPVWIDIPLDIQASMIDETSLRGFDPKELESQPEERTDVVGAVAKTIELLHRAERPIVLVGNGVRLAGAEADFLRLVQKLGVPVLTTRLGVDLIPADDPHLVGMPGGIAPRGTNFALQNSDCLLILGSRLDMALIAYAPKRLARCAKKIMVNIDGGEIRKLGGIVDVPVVADVGDFIRELIAQADRVRIGSGQWGPWIERCREWKTRYPFVRPEHFAHDDEISLYAFSKVLSDELACDDVVLPGAAGFTAEIFLTAFEVKAGQRVFHNKGTGAMGLCQPAAIGACLASNQHRTVAVDGDGGFQMNIQELETVKRLNLPVKFFVVNNGGYGSIRSSQQGYFHRLTAADATSGLSLPNLQELAKAYGLASVRVSDPKCMREQVRQVLAMSGPVLCEVVTIPTEPREPRLSTMQRPDGSLVSKPLEDMFPFLDREEFLANMIVPPLEED